MKILAVITCTCRSSSSVNYSPPSGFGVCGAEGLLSRPRSSGFAMVLFLNTFGRSAFGLFLMNRAMDSSMRVGVLFKALRSSGADGFVLFCSVLSSLTGRWLDDGDDFDEGDGKWVSMTWRCKTTKTSIHNTAAVRASFGRASRGRGGGGTAPLYGRPAKQSVYEDATSGVRVDYYYCYFRCTVDLTAARSACYECRYNIILLYDAPQRIRTSLCLYRETQLSRFFPCVT